jgi:hypothetical protein
MVVVIGNEKNLQLMGEKDSQVSKKQPEKGFIL